MRNFTLSYALGMAALIGLFSFCAFSARADHTKGHAQQWDDQSSRNGDTAADSGRQPDPAPPASRPRPPSRGGRVRQAPDALPPDASKLVPVDRETIRRGAKLFQDAVQAGRVRLLNSDREGAQLEGLRIDGIYTWPAPPGNPPRYYRTDPGSEGDGAAAADQGDASLPSPHASPSRFGTFDSRKPVSRGSAAQSVPGVDNSQGPALDTKVMVTAPPAELFLMLNALAARSSVQRPLEIMSLLRPPYQTASFQHAGITNPHSLGLAADISAFGGHRIRTDDPEECVQALLSLLRALPPGRYRMGLPKAPDAAPIPAIPAQGARDTPLKPGDPAGDRTTERPDSPLPSRGRRLQDDRNSGRGDDTGRKVGKIDGGTRAANQTDMLWPFFPPPQTGFDVKGKPVTRFANEHYAEEQFINDDRVRQALSDARRRGVDVFALFPDGLNHIHVDVKQVP